MIVRARRRLPVVLRALGPVAIALVGLTCRDRNPLGPGLPSHASLAVATNAASSPSGGPAIVLTNVHALLYPAAGGDTLVLNVAFTGDSAVLNFDNIIINGPSQQFILRIACTDANGDTLFRSLDSLMVTPGTNPPMVGTSLRYSGADSAVVGLNLVPLDTTISSATTAQFSATGYDNLGARTRAASTNIPVMVGWTSRDTTIATISASGVATGRGNAGTTWIVARTFTNVADSTQITVLGTVGIVSLDVDSANLSRGNTLQLNATTKDSLGNVLTGRTVTWNSLDPATATVDATGLVTGVAANATARIVATSGFGADTAYILVLPIPVKTLTASPDTVYVPAGDSADVTAQAFDSLARPDNDFPITWSSADSTIASVRYTGSGAAARIFGATQGTTMVRAKVGAIADTIVVIVTASAVDTVTISPAAPTVPRGDSVALSARLADALGNTISGVPVTWTSLNGEASVTSAGVVTGVSVGSAQVVAAAQSKADTVTVTVTAIPVTSIVAAPDTMLLVAGDSALATAAAFDSLARPDPDFAFTWTSGTTAIATVNSSGRVVGVSAGTAIVRATIGAVYDSIVVEVSGTSPVDSVAVTPRLDSLTSFGDSATLAAQAYSSGNPVAASFTWASRDAAVATVDAAGAVVAIANGTTYIVATETVSGRKDSAQVTVQQRAASIVVSPTGVQRYLGSQQAFTASAVDGRGNPVGSVTFRWSSKSAAVATIDSVTGVATMTGIGLDTVYAVSGSVTGRAAITVISAITKIVVTPDTVTLTALGVTQGYTAQAFDTLSAPMNGISFTFNSTNPSVAPLSNVTSTSVTATASANGVSFIQASAQGVTGQGRLNVQQALASIELTPVAPIIAPNGVVVVLARGKDSNNQYIPGGSFVYSSDNTGVATVGAANGVVTGVAIGTANITATSGAVTSNQSLVTVSNTVPAAISFGRDTLPIGRSTNQSIPIYLSTPDTVAHTVLLAVRDTFAYFSSAKAVIPAGQTTVNVTLNGRNAGSTLAYATDSAAVYSGDTAVITVQSNVRLTNSSYSVNATEQITGQQVLLSDPAPAGGVYVTFNYQNAGVVSASPDPAYVPPGQLASDIVITADSAGTTQITPVATGVNGTPSTVTVYAPNIASSGFQMFLGVGQYNSAGYLYVPTYTKSALAITTSGTDSTVATVPGTITIPAGGYYTYYNASGYKTGVDTVTFSRPGWASATLRIVVTTPVLDACCDNNINSTSGTVTFTLYTRDSVGNANYRLQPLFVSASSSDTNVVKVLDTLATVQAGQYYSNIRYQPTGGGSAWLRVSAGGHKPDSILVNVTAPKLSWNGTNQVVGVNQLKQNIAYMQIPNAVASPVIVRITHSDSTIIGIPDTVVITTGSYYRYVDMTGKKLGVDTLIISATGYSPDTMVMVVSSSKLDANIGGSFPIFTPDRQFPIYYRDSVGAANLAVNPVLISVTSTDSNVVRVDSSQVTIVAGGQYAYPAISFVGLGSAYVIVTAPGATPDTSGLMTVTSAKLSFSFGTTVQGVRSSRYTPFYVVIPNARTAPVTVSISHSAPGVMQFASGDSIVIGTGGYYQYSSPSLALALGTDTIIATSPGYDPDTAVYVVSSRHIDGDNLPGTGTTTDSPYAMYAYARDSLSNVDQNLDTLTLKLTSSDTTVLRLDSTYTHTYPGVNISTYRYARPVGPGTAYIVFSDSAGVLPADSSNAITITGPKLNFNTANLALGMKQQSTSDVYIQIPNSIGSDLTINLQSSDTSVMKVPATITMTAGSYYLYFPVYAQDTIGTVQITASAVGYSPPTPIAVQVGRPQFRVTTTPNAYTTSGPQTITVYSLDQNGTSRAVSEPVTVNVVSSAPGVATVDSATVTIPAGQIYTQAAHYTPVAVGTTTISASDPRSVYRAYLTGSQNISVTTPPLSISFSTMNLVQGMYEQFYIASATYEPDTLPVTITHSSGRTTTVSQIDIVKGNYYTGYTNIAANANGVDTMIVTAPGHLPDTAFVTVATGQIQQSGWPSTMIVGDSVGMYMYPRDAAGGAHYQSAAVTFTLTAPAQFVFTDGTQTITSITVQAGQQQSPVFYLKAVAAGTGVGSISQANYSTYTNSITVSP